MQPTILIVDDEKHTRDGLRRLFDEQYDTYIAEDIKGAMDVLEREQIDVLITDLRLAGDDGMTLIERALKLPRPPICIMMTAYGSVDTAVEAMKRGAYDFVTKPLNLDKVEILIARALSTRRIEQENRTLRQQVDERFGLENIVGESPVLREVLDTIRQVAPSSANVLIDGESGTGKELAAHAIHNLSRRHKAKFVTVHCAALSPTLLESELFGHERGAFTGAHERRIGRFEQANGGTIFLDEIGEIDQSTQVKLLRVISEERAFERVGGNQLLKADVRLIAATNKNLDAAGEGGKISRGPLFSPERGAHHDAAVARSEGGHPAAGARILEAFFEAEREATARSDDGRDEHAAASRLAGECARTADGDRAWRGDGERTKGDAARVAGEHPAGGGREFARRHSGGEGVWRTGEPARSARDGAAFDRAGAGEHERQCDRSGEEVGDQPADVASQDQRNERSQGGGGEKRAGHSGSGTRDSPTLAFRPLTSDFRLFSHARRR